MKQRLLMTRRSMLFSLVGLMMTAMLVLGGCGGSDSTGSGGYKVPSEESFVAQALQPKLQPGSATATSIVEPEDIINWILSGYLNNDANTVGSKASVNPVSKAATSVEQPKLVILSVSTPAAYAEGHIPGAMFMLNTEINKTREEGLAEIGSQAISGDMIDEVIQRSGIDKNTTIVFTVSKGGSFLNTARAYFNFRYWGFPKERLLILDGGDDAWQNFIDDNPQYANKFAITDAVTEVKKSTYSVKNGKNNFALRATIGDMITLVDSYNLGAITDSITSPKILDVRGGNINNTYMANAIVDDYAQYATKDGGATHKYKSISDIKERLAEFGVTEKTKMTYVYCASGTRAASTFFVLDNILGWPVTLYDGSWNQWGAYYYNTNPNTDEKKGDDGKVINYATYNLPQNSKWRIDIDTPDTNKPRTTGNLNTQGTTKLKLTTLSPLAEKLPYDDPSLNQMKVEDATYNTPSKSESSTQSGGGGEASGC